MFTAPDAGRVSLAVSIADTMASAAARAAVMAEMTRAVRRLDR